MDARELTGLVERLVAVDSVNPDLVPGAAGEAEVARVMAGWLERAGLEVELEEVAPGRPNVVAVSRGTGGGRSLLLCGHTDTVGVAGMDAPYAPRVEDGRLYGRGAYDMKGALAALMLAAAGPRLRGDVILAAVCDEEVGSIGAEALVRRVRADAAIVAEPTDMRVAIAHRGFAAFTIETRGRAAHGSRPDLGVDAIARMGPVLVRLAELDRSLQKREPHPLLGTPSVHASLIEGGQEYSSYPARCLLQGERRTLPGEPLELVEAELRRLIEGVDGSSRIVFAREPLEVAEDEPIVELLRRHSGAPLTGVPFWADSGVLAAAGIPTVLFGPGGEGAHAEVEWVDLADLERCARIFRAVAEEFCGSAAPPRAA